MINLFKKQPNYKPDVNNVQIPIVTIDATGNVLFSNQTADNLYGAKIVGKNITDLIASDLPSIIKGSSMSVRKAFKFQAEEKYVEISAKEDYSNHYFILTFNEVTKDYLLMNNLVEYRTSMDNLSKNKNKFLAQMTNVLKSPMFSSMGYSQAILEGMGGDTDERQRKYLSIIYKNSEELFKIIDKITELSKVEAQMVDFSYKNYDINNLLNALYTEFAPKANEKGLGLHIDTDNLTQKVIYGDEDILKTVLVHLLENAILSCDFGDVVISLSDKEFKENGQNFLKIRVSDPSTPVKESEMPFLFNPYYQPDKKSRVMLIKSLSLCIAGNLVGQMNGKFSAETEVSGFSVIIPTDKAIEPTVQV